MGVGRQRAAWREPMTWLVVGLPLVVVIVVNFAMALIVFPRLDFAFLEKEVWGGVTLSAVTGVWSVILALIAANLTVIAINFRRLPSLRESLDAGANSAALPIAAPTSPTMSRIRTSGQSV